MPVKRLGLCNAADRGMRNSIDKCPINLTEYKGIKALTIRHPQGASVACLEGIAQEFYNLLSDVT
jgi:hypothetical protein